MDNYPNGLTEIHPEQPDKKTPLETLLEELKKLDKQLSNNSGIKISIELATELLPIEAEREREIERLKGLLEKVVKNNGGYDMEKSEFNDSYRVFQTDELKEKEWQQFKTENQIQ